MLQFGGAGVELQIRKLEVDSAKYETHLYIAESTVSENVKLDSNINYEYALKDAMKAHEAIESGSTLGATVLIP